MLTGPFHFAAHLLAGLHRNLRVSAAFRCGASNLHWLRFAIGVTAIGYVVVTSHRTLAEGAFTWEHAYGFGAACLTGGAFFLFHRSPRLASAASLGVVWFKPILALVFRGEPYTAVLLPFPLVVAVSGLVFGRRAAQASSVVTMVALPLALGLHHLTARHVHPLSTLDVSALLVVEFALAGMGLITWAMVRSLDQALAASERLRLRYASLFENSPHGLISLDNSGQIREVNARAVALLGLERSTLPGTKLADALAAAGATRSIDFIRDSVAAPTEVVLTKSGAPDRHLEIVRQRSEGSDYQVILAVTSITDRRRAEQILRDSEERFRLLFNRSEDTIMVYTLGPDGTADHFIEVNDAACARLGYTRAELLSLAPARLEPTAAEPAAETRLAQLRATGRLVAETEHVTKDSRRFTVEVSAHLFEYKGQPTVLAIARDISARKALEQQLRQAQKMEVVGRLAGGVAHDFNNILTAMLLNLELMMQSAPDRVTRSYLGDLESMAKRAARLTQQLLLFARRQALRTSRIEVNSSLGQLLKMLRRLLGEHISIVTDFAPAPLWLEADSSLLDQAVMNLCLNARDAMHAGGTLTLSTRLAEFAAPLPPLHPEARPGRFACISVSDTGCGMQPEVVQHLFEPFFSTKEVGQGTGLGLASVHGIVHQHRGWIETETTVGKGSTFRMYLPLAETADAPAAAPPEAAARLDPGRETILLVEDEEIVRKVTRAMLEALGYRVLVATQGDEALRIWQEHSASIRLLLADVIMPGGISGTQLAEQLRRSKPHLPILLMSGYNVEMTRSATFHAAGVKFLAKPFDSRTLATSVRRCLEPAGASSPPA